MWCAVRRVDEHRDAVFVGSPDVLLQSERITRLAHVDQPGSHRCLWPEGLPKIRYCRNFNDARPDRPDRLVIYDA